MKKTNWLLVALLVVVAFWGGMLVSSRSLEKPFAPKPVTGVAAEQSGLPEHAEGGAGTILPCPSFRKLAKDLSPAVVNIFTTKVIKHRSESFQMPRRQFGWKDPFEEFFDRFFDAPQREMKQRSLGSGFLISDDGYVLTNNHVIEGADEIKVSLSDKRRYDAEVVGKDPKTDIALIRIKGKDFPHASLGDSDNIEVGDWVMAIGNPFGLSHTVTAGIVSATGRVIGAGPYDNFIQTDASINFGNSGGPLINTQGQVIGINTAIVARGQGIGFATPINMARDFLPQLKEKGKVTRGWLGVLIQTLTPELAETMGLKVREGAVVSQVMENSPAAEAGFKVGDVIIEFDGKAVTSHHDLPAIVAATPVGKRVKVKIIRPKDGKEKELVLSVKVAELKDEMYAEFYEKQKDEEAVFLGIEVRDITPEIAEELETKDRNGVLVVQVDRDSPAAEVGLQRGDIIREVNRKTVRNVSDFERYLSKRKKEDSVLLLVERGGQAFFLVLEGE